MALYQKLKPLQPLYDQGADSLNRAKVAFNILAIKSPSSTFEEELVKILVTAGVGVFGTSIFGSSAVVLPTGPGPYLSITTTGGPGPMYDQDHPGPSWERPTAEIVARAKSYLTARAMAQAAYDALVVVKNQTVTP